MFAHSCNVDLGRLVLSLAAPQIAAEGIWCLLTAQIIYARVFMW